MQALLAGMSMDTCDVTYYSSSWYSSTGTILQHLSENILTASSYTAHEAQNGTRSTEWHTS